MDIQDKIQLNETRNVNAVNVDTDIKLNLQSNLDLNTEYDLQNILDISQLFDDERQASTKYRIYGSFNYFSILNGLRRNYGLIEDFFVDPVAGTLLKDIYSDLRIYLVKPSSQPYTKISSTQERYVKKYEVIDRIIDIQDAGFQRDLFGEKQYTIIYNNDVDISNMFDPFGFPVTELALYVEYIPQTNGYNENEAMQKKVFIFNSGGFNRINFTPVQLNAGDIIDGDVIIYDKENFLQTTVDTAEQYIYTPLGGGNVVGGKSIDDKTIRWKYNPIIPIRLRYFDTTLRRVNTGTTDYQQSISIPNYATQLDNNGNFVWRDILDNGFIDPIENIGVAFPFINQKHYVFNNFVFKVQPDLLDPFTDDLFEEIRFPNNILDSTTPNSDLDDIGRICN